MSWIQRDPCDICGKESAYKCAKCKRRICPQDLAYKNIDGHPICSLCSKAEWEKEQKEKIENRKTDLYTGLFIAFMILLFILAGFLF